MKKKTLFISSISLLVCLIAVIVIVIINNVNSKPPIDIPGVTSTPTENETDAKVIFEKTFGDGEYIYIKSNGKAGAEGIENIGYTSELDEYVNQVKSVYLDDKAKNIESGTFEKFENCKKFVFHTSIEYIGTDVFCNFDSNVIFNGEKGEQIIIDEGNDFLYTDKLLASYKKVVFCHSDGLRYYVDGQMIKGFYENEGKIYYFDSESGIFNTEAEKRIGGITHYFNEDCSVKNGETVVDGAICYFEKGIKITGWVDIDKDGVNESFFRHEDGTKVVSDDTIDGKVYGMVDGKLGLKNGLAYIYGKTYYCVNGEKKSGFIQIDGKTFYFIDTTKERVETSTYYIDGFRREFNSDYSIRPISGWQQKDGKTCYYVDGNMKTGFVAIDGATYYFHESDNLYGNMADGWNFIGGEPYYFYPEGNEKHGQAAVGKLNINGNVYYFNSDGRVNTGAVRDNEGNDYYYYQTEKLHGWYKISGNVYYFTEVEGYKVIGKNVIGDTEYTFDENGVLLSPDHEAKELGANNGGDGNGFDIGGDGWSDIEFV